MRCLRNASLFDKRDTQKDRRQFIFVVVREGAHFNKTSFRRVETSTSRSVIMPLSELLNRPEGIT